MSLSYTYISTGNVKTIIAVSNKQFTYRIDVMYPEYSDVSKFSKGATIKSEEVMYSAVYDRLSRVKTESGSPTLLLSIKKLLPVEVFKGILFMNGEINFTEDTLFMEKIFVSETRGAVSKLRNKSYTEPENLHLVKQDDSLYVSIDLRNLAYFSSIKELNLESKDFRCLDTLEKVQEYIKEVSENKPKLTATDTETTGLQFYQSDCSSEIVGMSHSYKPYQGVYIPFLYKGKEIVNLKDCMRLWEVMFDFLSVYQNGNFDARVFRKYGIKIRNFIELMTALHILDPNSRKALKPVAYKLFGEDTIELTEILGENFDANLVQYIDLELMTVYACQDTDLTLRTALYMMDVLTENQKNTWFFDANIYEIFTEADWYGVPYRETKVVELLVTAKQDIKKMEEFILNWIEKKVVVRVAVKLGAKAEDLTSDMLNKLLTNDRFKRAVDNNMRGNRSDRLEIGYAADKKKIIYDILDYPPLVYTDAGRLSTGNELFDMLDVYENAEPSGEFDVDLMSSIYDTDPTKKVVLLSKDILNKKIFPFCEMMKQYAHLVTKHTTYSRILSSKTPGIYNKPYNYHNIVTGRVSHDIQIIPKFAKDAIGFELDGEWGMITSDFDQIEVRGEHNEAIRLWTEVMNSPDTPESTRLEMEKLDISQITKVFDGTGDVYIEQGARILGKQPQDVSPDERGVSKTTVLGVQYGSLAKTMAKKEATKCKTAEGYAELIRKFTKYRNGYLYANPHLMYYMDTLGPQGLVPIPESEIPFTREGKGRIGRIRGRSGRQRLFELDTIEDSTRYRIINQCLNMPMQSLCRDIAFMHMYFVYTKIREAGYGEDAVRFNLFVHDEFSIFYNKRLVNPIWLCSIINKYGCRKFLDHVIPYTCSPSVATNWKEGKSDKFSMPRGYLISLSEDPKDYPVLDTLNHRDYMYQEIYNWYANTCYSILSTSIVDKMLYLEKVDVGKNYYTVKNAKEHYKGIVQIDTNKNLNILLELAMETGKLKDITIVKSNGAIYTPEKTNEFTEKIEVSEVQDMFDFDLDEDMFEEEYVSANFINVTVNKQQLSELNKQYTYSYDVVDESYDNFMCKKYTPYIYFMLDKSAEGHLYKKDIDKIMNSIKKYQDLGTKEVKVFEKGVVVSQGFKININKFDLKKLDKAINDMRRSNKDGWENAKRN